MRTQYATTKLAVLICLATAFLAIVGIQSANVATINEGWLQLPDCTRIPWSISATASMIALASWAMVFSLSVSAFTFRVSPDTLRRCAIACVLSATVLDMLSSRMLGSNNVAGHILPYANHYGTVMYCAAALALCGRRRNLIVAAWLLVCCYLLNARYACGVILAMMTVRILPDRWRRPLLLCVLVAICLGLCIEIHYLVHKRQHEWTVATAILTRWPMFGAGTKANIYLAPLFAATCHWSTHQNGHNDILMWLQEYGTIGTSLLVTIGVGITAALRRHWTWNMASFALCCVLLHSMFDSPLHSLAALGMIICLVANAVKKNLVRK